MTNPEVNSLFARGSGNQPTVNTLFPLPSAATWFLIADGGGTMRRVNQYQFYQFGTILRSLTYIKEDDLLINHSWAIHSAKGWVRYFLDGSMVEVNVCREAAGNLLGALLRLIPDPQAGTHSPFAGVDAERKINWGEENSITRNLTEFETVLAAELPTIATYTVSKKGIYSTSDLTERAQLAIDEQARKAMSGDAKSDFQQAGKCLAFELPTASGFHTMRATEAVLRAYWKLVMNPTDEKKIPEMAKCISDLRSKGEDPKLMDILDHIRDLHRNTLMHPEAFLKMTEALRLFDIAKSAISAMGDRILVLREGITGTTIAAALAGASAKS